MRLEIIQVFFYNQYMKLLINKEKYDIDIADTFFKKFWGLMGKKNIDKGLFFPNTGSIHTFFMKQKIDVIMLNSDKKIILIKKEFPKNKILIKKDARYTIEFPASTLKNIHLNDDVIIER